MISLSWQARPSGGFRGLGGDEAAPGTGPWPVLSESKEEEASQREIVMLTWGIAAIQLAPRAQAWSTS